jgi:hypothetical protein
MEKINCSTQLPILSVIKVVQNEKRGGCEWYQSMGLLLLYIPANVLIFFKGPQPFK